MQHDTAPRLTQRGNSQAKEQQYQQAKRRGCTASPTTIINVIATRLEFILWVIHYYISPHLVVKVCEYSLAESCQAMRGIRAGNRRWNKTNLLLMSNWTSQPLTNRIWYLGWATKHDLMLKMGELTFRGCFSRRVGWFGTWNFGLREEFVAREGWVVV